MNNNFLSRNSEFLLMALQSLGTHKVRSLLTMLGIIFGVGAVIAMLSIGEGARQESLDQIEALGVRNIIIRSTPQEEEEDEEAGKTRPIGLSMKDAAAIEAICSFAAKTAVTWESEIDARTYTGKARIKLIGTTPEYRDIFNIRLTDGHFLIPHHIESTANVCVIGSDVKQELFGFTDPLRQMIKLDDQWFTVAGVMGKKSAGVAGSSMLPSVNEAVIIPLSTAMSKYPRQEKGSARRFSRRFRRGGMTDEIYMDRSTVDQIAVQISSGTDITEAAAVMGRLLRLRHNRQDDFTITIPEQLIAQSQKTQSIFNIVMGAIAGISLLVGGIGIMNIMLASVLERTREIGIRRAVGATRTMVIIQFLSEAVLLSVFGGIAGIGIGWGLTGIITAYAGWRTIVSFWSVGLAFSVAAATGILFGYYPARRAADKDVIEALRYE